MKRNLFAGRRRSGGLKLDVFTEDEIQDIHLATLEVLERTGVWVELDEALDIYSDGGCAVDRDAHIVRIPPHVVEDAIASAPPKVVLCGRDPRNDICLEPGRVGFSNFGEGIKVIDPETGRAARVHEEGPRRHRAPRRRPARGRRASRWPSSPATSRPSRSRLHNHEAAIVNQTKPISGGAQDGDAVHRTVEMLAAVQGGKDEVRRRPMMVMGTCPVSPLKLVKDFCEIVIESARVGLPSCVLSMAMAGGSSPVTLAGTLVTHNAEVLAGIVLGAAHRARQQAAVRLVDDRHGPPSGGGLSRLAGVRADQRRRGPARQAVPPAELHRRCVGGQQAQ